MEIISYAIGYKNGQESDPSSVTVEALNVTENKTYTAPSGKAYSPVKVNVPNSYVAGDEGKVVSNGALVVQTAHAEITENGTYDTTLNDEVTVNVSGGGSAVVQPLSVTQNGTYTPPSGVDGYAPVTVNVSGGGDDPFALTNYIESSGTQWIDTGYVPNINTKIETLVDYENTQSNYAMIFGGRDTASGTAGNPVCLGVRSNGSMSFNYGFGFSFTAASGSNEYQSRKTLIHMDQSGFDVLANNDFTHFGVRYTPRSQITSHSLYLFSLNAGGSDFGAATHCAMKLYRFRVWENNTLMHEFIPWREGGVACLKDTVTGNIKYNAGTGDFVYGTDT